MTEGKDWSVAAVTGAADRARLVINAILCAEVSVRYSRIEDLEVALPQTMLAREAIPCEAACPAGKALPGPAAAAGRPRWAVGRLAGRHLRQACSDFL